MKIISRIIVITGQRGVGKSSVCVKVAQSARKKGLTCGGIITCKSQDSGIIVEDVDTGDCKILASRKPEYHGPSTGKYFFNPEGLRFGLTALKKGLSMDLLFIDELGHLEVNGGGFAAAFDYLALDTFKHAVVVIREELLATLLPRFFTLPAIISVTRDNRDSLAERIVSAVLSHKPLP